MTNESLQAAAAELQSVVRRHSKDPQEVMMIYATAMAFDAAEAKDPKTSWLKLKQWVLGLVQTSLNFTQQCLEQNQPHG